MFDLTKNKIRSVITVVMLLFISTSFVGCTGTPNLSQDTCDIVVPVLETVNNLMETLPVPDEIKFYVNLAYINIRLLCSAVPNSAEYEQANSSLQFATGKINTWLQTYNSTTPDNENEQ